MIDALIVAHFRTAHQHISREKARCAGWGSLCCCSLLHLTRHAGDYSKILTIIPAHFDSFDTMASRSSIHGSESRSHIPPWNAVSDHIEQQHDDYHDKYHHGSHMDPHERAPLTDVNSFRRGPARDQTPYYTGLSVDRDEVLQMQKRISMLERQLTSSTNTRTVNQKSRVDTVDPDASQAIDGIIEDNFGDVTEQTRFIPQIIKRNVMEFTNKYGDDKEEYAIELLMRDNDSLSPPSETLRTNTKMAHRRGSDPLLNTHRESSHKPSDRASKAVPARIRINSPLILASLSNIDPDIDPTVPLVLLRPWKFLAHHEQRIREIFRSAKEEGSPQTRPSDNGSEAVVMTESSTTSEPATALPNSAHSQDETQHLQCLIEFIDQYIKPLKERFEGTKSTKVRFKDLFFLFRPGDDVYMPIKVRGRLMRADAVGWTAEAFQGRYERLWRVTATTGGYWNLPADSSHDTNLNATPFKVSCYYIDYDGKYFLPITHTFSIMPFEGEEDITSLDFYPVRYLTSAPEIVDTVGRRGQTVFESLSKQSAHYYYSGPTLVMHPCGCPIQGENLTQEYIESEVIVDFSAALLSFPSWRPKASLWKPPARTPHNKEFPTRHWLDQSRQTSLGETHDNTYDDYVLDLERAVAFREQESIFAPIPSGWLSNRSRVPEKDMSILAYCGFAFILRTRTFAPISLWHLHEIRPQADGLNSLQLKDNTMKENIRALVRTHFRHEEQNRIGGDLEYDIIRGKGKGLVILLHGAPGVGKSSTAESVAAANGRPLFQITCGDLGLTPKEVEKALKEIFRYAQMWGCILLLDECDIFLAARTKSEIQRNSLVSVFLRVLEFYSGVLFLTTNRVGVLDDAVRSRITWTIYYPPLDEQQTQRIWKGNLKQVEERNKNVDVDRKGIMRFARDLFDRSTEAQPSWNGRQIQNAFKVAVALAEWEGMSDEERYSLDPKIKADDSSPKIQLQPSHFERIAAGTQAFDRYIHLVTGASEARRAWNLKERADDHRPEDDEDNSNDLLSPPLEDSRRSPLNNGHHGRRTSMTSPSIQTRGSELKISHHAHSTKRLTSQTSQYPLSPPFPESSMGAFTQSPQNTRDRRYFANMGSGQVVAENGLQHQQSRRSETGNAIKRKQFSTGKESARVPSIDVADANYEHDSKRQRIDGPFVSNHELSDGDEGLAVVSDDGWGDEGA